MADKKKTTEEIVQQSVDDQIDAYAPPSSVVREALRKAVKEYREEQKRRQHNE